MRILMVLCVVLVLPVIAMTAFPPNYWELPPEQQIEILFSEGWGEYELNKIGKDAALPALHSLLAKYVTTDEKKAETIINMLLEFHDESSIDPLMQAWEKNKKLEKEIVETLSWIYEKNNRSEKAYKAMINLMKAPRYDYGDEYFGVDDRLFDNLVRNADKSKVPYLISFLKDSNFPQPWIVIEKLGEIGDPPVVVPVIAEFLKHPLPDRRITASETLGDIGSNLAIPYLKDAVKTEKEVRAKLNMAAQLVKLGEFLYLEEILKVFEDPKWSIFSDVRGWAFDWLRELSGQDFGEDVAAWRKWFEDEKERRGLK